MWNYVLHVNTRAVALRVEVNDVPRWDRPGNDSDAISAVLNPWVAAGRNTLRLTIDWPEGISYEPGRADVDLTLERRPHQPGAGEPRVLARFRWPGKAEEAYPAAQALDFDVEPAPPSRLWPRVAPEALSPDAQSEIRALAARLHGALAARNTDLACDLLDFRTVDVAQSLYRPAAESRNGQRAALEELLTAENDLRLQPLRRDELELHPVAGSRLIWVTRPDRAPALMIHSRSGVSRMPLYVAKLNGNWTIVR
jgi:hypothetical protein